jgi:hypothetical protein
MTYVSVLVPVAQGVGVFAALKRAADRTFDERSRGHHLIGTRTHRRQLIEIEHTFEYTPSTDKFGVTTSP